MSLKTLNKMVHEKLKNMKVPNVIPAYMVGARKVNKILKLKEKNMTFNEIRKMAKGMQINTNRLKLPDIIRSIQRAENNIECFGTQRVDSCNENVCLWRNRCLLSQH
jgi:hypothetical protein